MSTTNLIPFDLAIALKHPERVRNVHGDTAIRVIHIPEVDPSYRVTILWPGKNVLCTYTEDGYLYDTDTDPSLFLTAPEPVYVPWTSLAKVPLDHWFRLKDGTIASRITDMNLDTQHIQLSTHYRIRLADLYTTYLHSADPVNGPWLPCGKLATT